ncbi:hypothetical protein AB0M36_13770 [Actinoplanes sp. NPDC051346]|uniref:hypothetical protein n=1 Tax=Actinoplanes sp. NPDC051346 TaxID=3155048 RepID=UPI0034131AED
MLWPVLLDACPCDTPWAVGKRVSTPLRWIHDPELPDDLVLRETVVRSSPLRNVFGEQWANLITSGDLRAVLQGDYRTGEVTLDGCLAHDTFFEGLSDLPVTVGVVRRIRLVQYLYDRGAEDWVRRPVGPRLIDVPDTDDLPDDPPLFDAEPTPPDWEPEPGTMRLFSPEEWFRLVRDKLPEEQWQARGFLVDLEA